MPALELGKGGIWCSRFGCRYGLPLWPMALLCVRTLLLRITFITFCSLALAGKSSCQGRGDSPLPFDRSLYYYSHLVPAVFFFLFLPIRVLPLLTLLGIPDSSSESSNLGRNLWVSVRSSSELHGAGPTGQLSWTMSPPCGVFWNCICSRWFPYLLGVEEAGFGVENLTPSFFTLCHFPFDCDFCPPRSKSQESWACHEPRSKACFSPHALAILR